MALTIMTAQITPPFMLKAISGYWLKLDTLMEEKLC